MSLVGKFFFYSMSDGEEELYNFGEVVSVYNDSFYMLKNMSSERITRTLFNITQMTNGGQDFWCFFDTKEEMEDYVSWVESPPKPEENKVVKLVKKD